MCRHLAYLGPPRTLHELLRAQKHSLEVQSYAPKEMETALMNADGFGVAWLAEDGFARYRSSLPMWGDENLPELAPHVRSGCVLANARSATPGIGMGLANTQPFLHAGWAFSHNGYVRGFRKGPMRRMQSALGDAAYEAIRGTSDSEHLFAAFLDAKGDVATRLRETVHAVRAAAPEAKALLSLTVSDGESIAALRHALHGAAPTLYVLRDEGAVWFASEALDARPWEPLPEATLVVADARGVREERL